MAARVSGAGCRGRRRVHPGRITCTARYIHGKDRLLLGIFVPVARRSFLSPSRRFAEHIDHEHGVYENHKDAEADEDQRVLA